MTEDEEREMLFNRSQEYHGDSEKLNKDKR